MFCCSKMTIQGTNICTFSSSMQTASFNCFFTEDPQQVLQLLCGSGSPPAQYASHAYEVMVKQINSHHFPVVSARNHCRSFKVISDITATRFAGARLVLLEDDGPGRARRETHSSFLIAFLRSLPFNTSISEFQQFLVWHGLSFVSNLPHTNCLTPHLRHIEISWRVTIGFRPGERENESRVSVHFFVLKEVSDIT